MFTVCEFISPCLLLPVFSPCSRLAAWNQLFDPWFVHVSLSFCLFHLCLFVSSLLSCSLQEEDFQEMLRTAQLMETQYGHLFEKVIVNDDLTTAFSELRLALKKVEMETHWVPVSWTHS